MSVAFQGFDKALFKFLRDLGKNNNREWFAQNKGRYEREVQEPILAFIGAMKPRLRKISKHIVADERKVGGSMFRIYRDTRFSKDKTPYKEHVGVQFRHQGGKDVHAPGYYFHVSASGLMVGMGIWRPDGAALAKIRASMDSNPKRWLAARDDERLRQYFTLGGESLKRPPAGFAKDHALVEDLKRKDIVGFHEGKPSRVLDPGFVDWLADAYDAAKPMMRFVCKALDLPF